MSDYAEYLARKKPRMPDAGFDPPPARPAAGLRDYQQLVVDRMLRQGRGCVFADCGAGKTRIELEWARAVAEHTDRPVLILTPLAVGRQMRAEAAEMGIRIALAHDSSCAENRWRSPTTSGSTTSTRGITPASCLTSRASSRISPGQPGRRSPSGRQIRAVPPRRHGHAGAERHHGAPDSCAVARHHDRARGTGHMDGQRRQHGRPLLAPQGACRCGLLAMGADVGEHLPPAV